MSAGDFAKAMKRTGNDALGDVNNLFKSIQQQRQKAESQKAIANFLSQYNAQAQKAKGDATTHPLTPMRTTQPAQTDIGGNVANQLTGVNLPNKAITTQGAAVNGMYPTSTSYAPQPKPSDNIVAPLKDESSQGSYVGTQYNPYQQNKQLGQGYVQSMMSLISNPDVLPEEKRKSPQNAV